MSPPGRRTSILDVSRPLLVLVVLAASCAPAAPPQTPAPEAVKRVRIVHTSDVHGRLLPQRPGWANGRAVGGLAALAAHFDSAAARFGGPTVFLSAGDDLQGTALSNLSWGRAVVAAHNAAGYDAAALGNHEFDWGLDTLRARVGESGFPWLAANVHAAGTTRPPAWVRPWTMVERGGVRVAVIGVASPKTPEMVMAGRTAGVEFGPPAPAVDRAAREARAAGADFVVAVMHVGAECADPGDEPEEASAGCTGEMLDVAAALAEPVDLVLGGHTHLRVLTTAGALPVAEPMPYTQAYTVTDLERRGGRSVAVHRSVRVPYVDEVTPDTAVARVVREWEERVRPLAERGIATLAAEMPWPDPNRGEWPVGNLLADAFRRATGAQAVIVNSGSIRRGLPAGPVSYGTLYELQPFQNALVTVEATGAQLRAALENGLDDQGRINAHVSGLSVVYDSAAPPGSRVRSITLDGGRAVRDGDRVTLGLTEFVATGGDRFAMFRDLPRTNTGVVELDALIAHLQALPHPVPPPATGRWRKDRPK